MLFAGIGPEGQERLAAASAVIVGCGAIGRRGWRICWSAQASGVFESWIGILWSPPTCSGKFFSTKRMRGEALPKAVAAERKLRALNSEIKIEGVVADLNSRNVEELLSGFPLILDGTDNFETRFLVNDFAIHAGTPWIYAAAVASYGLTLTIRPQQTACLACLLETGGAPGLEETCDTVGVLGPIVNLIASLEAAEALKLLSANESELHGRLISCDVWTGRFQSVQPERNPNCRACARREFPYLEGQAQPHVTMCGRDSVQIHERGAHPGPSGPAAAACFHHSRGAAERLSAAIPVGSL